MKPTTHLFLLAVLCSCGSENSEYEPPVPSCRAALECQLSGEETCGSEGEALMSCTSTQCQDDEALSECLSGPCFEPLHDCYFGAESGTSACADMWRCFGDCEDSEICLQGCLAAGAKGAQQRFAAAELCTDAYVLLQCALPGADCDLDAAQACSSQIQACVDDNNIEVKAWMSKGCAKQDSDCTQRNIRILAACPSNDATQWQSYLECLSSEEAESCNKPTLSPICQEIELLPNPAD